LSTVTASHNTANTCNNLEQLTVAAVDESYSNKCNNLAYMTVVCSIPGMDYDLSKLPKPKKVFKNPDEHGLIVAAVMVPLGKKEDNDRASWWRKGVWYGLSYVNSLLEREGHRIDIAYVDGGEPENFRSFEDADRSLNIQFESKHGTRSYEKDADPYAVKLLRIADGVVGLFRKHMDKQNKDRLEIITDLLSKQQKLCITLVPELPDLDYIIRQHDAEQVV
jgi:hypothetical protein